MFLFKCLLVFLLSAVGVVALLNGSGVDVPVVKVVKYKGLEAYGIPAGVVILAAAVAVGYFWRIERTVETSTTTSPSGETTVKTTDTTKGVR